MSKETVFWALYYHIFEAVKKGVDILTFEGEQFNAAVYFSEWIAKNE